MGSYVDSLLAVPRVPRDLLRTQGGVVDVQLQAEPGHLALVVDDSGPGIAPDERQRVLQRFHRGPQDGGTAVAGSGLGLAIAESIARMHGTRLELSSAPRLGGLRVCVRLARAAERGEGAHA